MVKFLTQFTYNTVPSPNTALQWGCTVAIKVPTEIQKLNAISMSI